MLRMKHSGAAPVCLLVEALLDLGCGGVTEVADNSETMGLGKTGKGDRLSVFLETLLEDLFKHMFVD